MFRKIFRNRNSSFCPALAFLVCFVAFVSSLMAQTVGTGILTGRVTNASGNVIANAAVTATSVDTGQIHSATTGADGSYRFEGLPSGTYWVKFEAAGFKMVEIPSAKVTGAEAVVLDEKLDVGEPINGKPAPSQQNTLPNAPSSNTTAPSLEDLGLTPQQTQGSAQDQAQARQTDAHAQDPSAARFDHDRSVDRHVLTSATPAERAPAPPIATLHMALGAVTGDLYFMTAYYAIRAPRIPGTETRGPIRLHKAMAWIHGPGMILTPILGAIAYRSKKQRGKGSRHRHRRTGRLPSSRARPLGLAVLSVSVKF